MECNKDEATRAKEIAERKFNEKDTSGAKKFALKAQNLFPSLEGIPQMIATLDVYIAAENKVKGEADWYGILGVNPRADDDTVRKHYRKLALMLHPDKNKSVGADGAFKFISEAWSILSDKARRAAYDEKINAKAQKGSTIFGGSSAKAAANGANNSKKKPPSSSRTQKNTAKEQASSANKSKSTFWTTCHRCKMQYEYLRMYLNLKLVCPSCHEAFLALETNPPPASGIRPGATLNFKQKPDHQGPHKSKSNAGKNNMSAPNVGAGSNKNSFQWAPFSNSGVSNVAQAANVVQQAYHKVKRDREEAQAATKKEEALRRKQNVSKKGYFNPAKRKRGGMEGNGASNLGNGMKKFNSTRDLPPVELQNLLVEKARKEISKKLREFQSNTVDKSVAKKSGDCFQKEDRKGEFSARNSEICTRNSIGKSEGAKNSLQASTSFAAPTIDSNCMEILDSLLVDFPDPDFHDFFKDRTERSFGENQVWTAYEGDDGMPRRYALIHKVISLNPFKLQISWLHPNTNSGEPGHQNWIALGFSKTCGDFRIGKREIYDSINYFSQKVRWIKGNNGAICIYPKKGEVWAIYSNWSPNWNELISGDVIHKFIMVEVLEDFVEEHGVTVIPLVKVAGFKAVFHHHFDEKEIKIIPRKEMLRFSHQVPSYVLTGEEAANAPKGCRVLDPAATPCELLEVIKVAQEESIVDNVDGIAEEAICEEMASDMGQLGGAKEGLKKVIHKMETSEEERGKKICIGL
ncbi:Chaperone DnaJ-domain superfamily protein [Trifolium repens]|nr:Chaperone DnaJ-domain superfamily protein [Trifolium repens]